MKTGTKLGLVAVALALGTLVVWVSLTRQVNIPDNRTGFVIAFLLAAVLGVAAYVKRTSLLGGIPPAIAIVIGLLLPLTIAVSQQGLDTTRAVKVGDHVPHFTALDDQGQGFDSNALDGKLVLIKFFRGHWEPYCFAELRRLAELHGELARRGVQVVTVSPELPAEIAAGRPSHGLQARMLSDSELLVTDAFGMRNTGIHSAPPGVKAEALPVPATLLVDGEGKVLWMDIPENYQRRSAPSVVLAAMQQHFDAIQR